MQGNQTVIFSRYFVLVFPTFQRSPSDGHIGSDVLTPGACVGDAGSDLACDIFDSFPQLFSASSLL